MTSDKLPAIQFYPGDWHKDQGVQALDLMQRGAWFELLLMMHDSEERGVLLLNGRPMPEDIIARRLHLDNQNTNQILTTLLTYGVASRRESDGAIICRRMIRDERLRQIRRECGKKGGNPRLLNQNTKQTETTGDNQIPTPSSSSSSSSSISSSVREEIPPNPQGGEDAGEGPGENSTTPGSLPSADSAAPTSTTARRPADALPRLPAALDVPAFRDAWDRWLKYQREKRKKLTPSSAAAQLAQCEAWGVEQATAAIGQSIKHGWQGLFDPKPATNGRTGNHAAPDSRHVIPGQPGGQPVRRIKYLEGVVADA